MKQTKIVVNNKTMTVVTKSIFYYCLLDLTSQLIDFLILYFDSLEESNIDKYDELIMEVGNLCLIELKDLKAALYQQKKAST